MNTYMQSVTNTFRRSIAPVTIAAIHGAAFGGGAELASACDLRVGGPSTGAAFVQAKMGLCTGWGGTHLLHGAVGRAAALRLLLSAAPHSSEQLQRLGWLTDTASAAELKNEESTAPGVEAAIGDDEWAAAVAAGAPCLETHQADTGDAADTGALAHLLQQHPPGQLDTSVLSRDAVRLLHYCANTYALPARSAALARVPKRILNSNDQLAAERDAFGELWRGEAHTAALAEANR